MSTMNASPVVDLALTDDQLDGAAGGNFLGGLGDAVFGMAEVAASAIGLGETLGVATPLAVTGFAHGGYEFGKGMNEMLGVK